MNKDVLVNLQALNEVVKYLTGRPYKEVVILLDDLKASVKEIPNEEAQETPKESNGVSET